MDDMGKELDFDIEMDDIDDGLEPIQTGVILYIILMIAIILFARTPLYNLIMKLGLPVTFTNESEFFFGPLVIAIAFSPVVSGIIIPVVTIILLTIIGMFGKPGRKLTDIICYILGKMFGCRFGFLAYILYFTVVFFGILILTSLLNEDILTIAVEVNTYAKII